VIYTHFIVLGHRLTSGFASHHLFVWFSVTVVYNSYIRWATPDLR